MYRSHDVRSCHASACVRNGCRGQIRQPVAVALLVGWWEATGSAAGHHSATADVTAIARPWLWCRWRARSARARPSPCGYLCNRTSACCALRWCASPSATCVPACTQHTAHAMAAWGEFPRCVLVRAAIPCAVAGWNARHISRAHSLVPGPPAHRGRLCCKVLKQCRNEFGLYGRGGLPSLVDSFYEPPWV